jgi:malate dehydrogenase
VAELMLGNVTQAFDRVNALPPDLRMALKPYASVLSGAKTSFATANAVEDLIRTILDGREIVIAGKVRVSGEFRGLSGVFGVPVAVGRTDGIRVLDVPLASGEESHLPRIASRLDEKIGGMAC